MIRTGGQLMADLLAHHLVNPATPDASADAAAVADASVALPAGVNVEIPLVMTDRTLLDGDNGPALLNGDHIPAPLARRLFTGPGVRAGRTVQVWIRRLFTAPGSGELVTCDKSRRLFPDAARSFLLARDQVCRTPWCGAPIRHADHIIAFAAGGPTHLDNAQRLRENCNQTKELAGSSTARRPDGAVETITPTGHQYQSHPPPPPHSAPWPNGRLTWTSIASPGRASPAG